MKTLQLFNIYQQYGGEENVVRSLSELMAGPDWRDLFFDSREWAQESLMGKLTQPARTFWNPASLKRVEAAHREHPSDVWLFHNVLPVGSLSLFHLAARLGMPVIQYLHNYRPFSPGGIAWHQGRLMEDGLQRRFWPEVMAGTYRGSRLQTLFISLVLHAYFKTGAVNAVTTWLSQTEFQKAKFMKAGIPAEQIEVLPPPRPPAPFPQRWEDEGYLLFLGRLVPEKGIRFLLDQWEKAGQNLPKLVIAGAGPLEAEVRQRVTSLPQVTFVGQVDAAGREKLLASCSGLVVPSEWWEVLGLVVLEAYEMEKPVVAARTGGLGEIVMPGKTGFQFEPGDAHGFHSAVSHLMGCSSEARRELGRNGWRWARETSDTDRWKENYLGLVERTVRRKKQQKAQDSGLGPVNSVLRRGRLSAE